MKNHLGNGNYEIICDKCGAIIGVDNNYDTTVAIKHKDLNFGHECKNCKGKRESDYDDYIDPQRAYR